MWGVAHNVVCIEAQQQRIPKCHASFYLHHGILVLVNLSRLTMNLTLSVPHDVWGALLSPKNATDSLEPQRVSLGILGFEL